MSKDIRTPDQLEAYLTTKGLTWKSCFLPPKNAFLETFSLRIPISYADLINWSDPNDPLRLMVLPSRNEKKTRAYELADPIGDKAHEPVAGLIHRYPDRCLLMLTSHCGIHCRFCFRREVVGKVRPIDLGGIEEYLGQHKEIREIIFSGGDPGTFPPEFFASIVSRLDRFDHIRSLRVHTRVLVVDPEQFSQAWLKALLGNGQQQRIVVLHINHAREVTQELDLMVKQLKKSGVTVLSQSVLLAGVNDDYQVLKNLFTRISEVGIKPYYLHHLDQAMGTHHFRVSIRRGRTLYTSLRGQLAGYKIPEYVIDLPGGNGKVPVMWLRAIDGGHGGNYEVENLHGKTILYQDPSEMKE